MKEESDWIVSPELAADAAIILVVIVVLFYYGRKKKKELEKQKESDLHNIINSDEDDTMQ